MTANPPSDPPSTFAIGTRQSWKTSSAVWLPRNPIFRSFCATVNPGHPFSTSQGNDAAPLVALMDPCVDDEDVQRPARS